jgi:chromosome partitioning protein
MDTNLNFSQLKSLFDITDSRDTFYDLADIGKEIPKPIRKSHGYRFWPVEALPEISKRYKVLSETSSGIAPIINFYLSKGGGSHKTTDAYNFSCYMGMMGKKVLVLGLDFQLNISKKFGINNSVSNIKQTGEYYAGIYEVLEQGTDIKDVVAETTMPNVFLIPESSNLVRLEAWLVGQIRREEKLSNALEPLRDYFDVIVIDNNPSWSQLSISSLCACDVNVASIGLDSNSNEALPQFFETLEASGIAPRDIILAGGMFEKTILKKQLKEFIKENYGTMFAETIIRKSTIVDEANAKHLPVFIYKPKEKVSEDYLNLCEEIWDRAVIATDLNNGIEQTQQ